MKIFYIHGCQSKFILFEIILITNTIIYLLTYACSKQKTNDALIKNQGLYLFLYK